MSTMNPLPPQAYTKETLVHAYAWLQSQSDNIKQIATTPDVLVSLFLKAKMQGDGALERPSIQNFKNELKNLAGMMGEFEDSDANSETPPGAARHSQSQASQTFRFRSQDFKIDRHSKTETLSAPIAPPPPKQEPKQESKPADPQASKFQASDDRSLDMIQEVKTQFNLSSDTEAMRLLIAVGYNQVKGLLK